MPRFIQTLAKKYPYTADLLNELPKLRTRSPRVFRAYLQHTGMTTDQGQMSLFSYGAVMVRDEKFHMRMVPKVEVSTEIPGYARFYGDNLILRKTFVEQYEALMDFDEWTGRDPHGQYDEERLGAAHSVSWYRKRAKLLMESKVLHEMVHWARSLVTFLPDPKVPDHGWKFERSAYGKHLTHSSLELTYYLRVPGQQ